MHTRAQHLFHVFIRLSLIGTLTGFSALAQALMQAPTQEPETPAKVWLESPLQLPAAPAQENYLAFYKSAQQKFFIDTQSLTIAKDGSFRYTLISTSQSGAKNISYEGLRCDSYEKKIYAFGRTDGSWSPSRNAEWSGISNSGVNRQHASLAQEFVCEGLSVSGDIERILQRIRSNQPLRAF